jgi:hypothetical protein
MLEEYIDINVHKIMSEKVLENTRISEFVQPVRSVVK